MTILGGAVPESHSGNFFQVLTLLPTAPEAAEPQQRLLLVNHCCGFRSSTSRLGFPFLWEQKWVSGGEILEAFQ